MIAKTSRIASFLSFLRELCRSASSIVVSPRYTDFYRPVRCISDLTIRAPCQLKPMATSVRASCVSARTNNYLWHDCQLNIVPAPNIARLASPSPCIYLSVSEPFSSGPWCTGGMAATGDSRNVRRRTNCVHSPPAHNPWPLYPVPLSPSLNSPPSPLLVSPSPRLSLSLSLALFELPTQPGDSVYSGVNFALQTRTNHCRCNCMQLSPSAFFPIWFKVPVENYMCVKECVCVCVSR